MAEQRRLRSKADRIALWLAAGGRCQLCGRELLPGWHADHVEPWNVTRRTNVFEMQALCPTCNGRKGSAMELAEKVERAQRLCDQIEHFASALRKPQRETLRLLRGIVTGLGGGDWPYLTSPGFLVDEVNPGGGKSYIAVMSSSVLVGSGLFDVGLWMSPRLSLIQQAKDDFSSTSLGVTKFGKAVPIFNPAMLVPEGVPDRLQLLLKPTAKMWVLPYQRLHGMTEVLAHLTGAKNVLLIFDEFQLLREANERQRDDLVVETSDGWYDDVKPLVENCRRRTGFGGLILSGGLYRNEGRRLPFISYRQGDFARGEDPKKSYPLADVTYTLSEAQGDRALILMDFDFYPGEVGFRIGEGPLFDASCEDGELESISELTREHYNDKLVHFLEEPDVWQTIIRDMLTSLDSYNPPGQGYHARYMVISKSIPDAETHAKFLEERCHRVPLLVHSKMSQADQKLLEQFRRGHGPWDGLVAVGIGYIGLSVPDLSHLAYLSHYRSAAWINQAFHRVTRFDSNPRAPRYEDQLARIFLPNDPAMKKIADQIMRSQNPGVLALPRPTPPPPGPPGGGRGSDFEGLSASILGREFNTNGEACHEHDFIDQAVRSIPALNVLPRMTVEEFKRFSDGYGSRED
jgi:hypothetical protein